MPLKDFQTFLKEMVDLPTQGNNSRAETIERLADTHALSFRRLIRMGLKSRQFEHDEEFVADLKQLMELLQGPDKHHPDELPVQGKKPDNSLNNVVTPAAADRASGSPGGGGGGGMGGGS